ncbi:host attachment protein [Marinobacter sp. F4206]|uniref:host attachment protein n=1 Tax=Marinobacter sp. F4206 TaxID=2861777 RepID=UPI001C5D6787|nr:host attachment protein [Marinobacter sp. F4206]MBW4934090.1 host attachment protein [Marinobacter sp. F4206]
MNKDSDDPLARKRLYVLVADNAQARLFQATTPVRALDEVMTREHPAGRLKDSERYSDRPGSDHGGVGGHQSYDREKSDDPEEERFARDLSEQLEKARHEGRFEKLVLVAPPNFLGALRHHLSKDCLTAVVKSIDKDLVRQDPEAIIQHLGL